MDAQNRRTLILSDLYRSHVLDIVELARKLNVSEMTIRRDLTKLEQEGLIHRTHGGAISSHAPSTEPPFPKRSTENVTAKESIGKLAAQLICDGDKIALDVGTTTLEVARNINNFHNLTILTTSIRIAYLFLNQSNIHVIIPGGVIRPLEGSLIGEFTQKFFKGIYFDKLFLGIGGIDAGAGLTEYNLDEALVKRSLVQCAKEIIVVADKSKFNRTAFSEVAPISSIHHFITNELPPPPLLNELNRYQVRIHLTSEEIL